MNYSAFHAELWTIRKFLRIFLQLLNIECTLRLFPQIQLQKICNGRTFVWLLNSSRLGESIEFLFELKTFSMKSLDTWDSVLSSQIKLYKYLIKLTKIFMQKLKGTWKQFWLSKIAFSKSDYIDQTNCKRDFPEILQYVASLWTFNSIPCYVQIPLRELNPTVYRSLIISRFPK